MALIAGSTYAPQNLQDVLGQQAQAATNSVNDQYNQQRKRTVAGEAANGRLMSGVSDYPLADLDTQQGSTLSGVQSQLGTSLGSISSEDWLNNQDFLRQYGLAGQIGSYARPSSLDEFFQGIGAVGPIAAAYAGSRQ